MWVMPQKTAVQHALSHILPCWPQGCELPHYERVHGGGSVTGTLVQPLGTELDTQPPASKKVGTPGLPPQRQMHEQPAGAQAWAPATPGSQPLDRPAQLSPTPDPPNRETLNRWCLQPPRLCGCMTQHGKHTDWVAQRGPPEPVIRQQDCQSFAQPRACDLREQMPGLPEALGSPLPSCAGGPVGRGLCTCLGASHGCPAGRRRLPCVVPSSPSAGLRSLLPGATWRACFHCRPLAARAALHVIPGSAAGCRLGNSVSEATSPTTPAPGTRVRAARIFERVGGQRPSSRYVHRPGAFWISPQEWSKTPHTKQNAAGISILVPGSPARGQPLSSVSRTKPSPLGPPAGLWGGTTSPFNG